jgi:hypothetical protein
MAFPFVFTMRTILLIFPGLRRLSIHDAWTRERALTTRDLVIDGMIFMVPIAPYWVFGFVWTDAKGRVPLAYRSVWSECFSRR